MRIRSAVTVFFISVLILFPIRIKTLLSGVDISDEFFTGEKLPAVFLGVVALSALMIFIICKRAVNVPSYIRVKRSVLCTFSSLIMAGLVCYDSVITLGGRYSDIFIGNRSTIYGFLGILAAVAILLFAFSFLTGNPVASKVPVLTLVPAIWACARLTLLFMHYTTIANISLYYFDICYYTCFLIFMFSQAKVFSSIDTRKSIKLSVFFGLFSCVFSAVSVCARLWINLLKTEALPTIRLFPTLWTLLL